MGKLDPWTEEELAMLSDRERRVIQLRFGLFDGKQRTLEQVSLRFGVTRERIRQIEAQAFRHANKKALAAKA